MYIRTRAWRDAWSALLLGAVPTRRDACDEVLPPAVKRPPDPGRCVTWKCTLRSRVCEPGQKRSLGFQSGLRKIKHRGEGQRDQHARTLGTTALFTLLRATSLLALLSAPCNGFQEAKCHRTGPVLYRTLARGRSCCWTLSRLDAVQRRCSTYACADSPQASGPPPSSCCGRVFVGTDRFLARPPLQQIP